MPTASTSVFGYYEIVSEAEPLDLADGEMARHVTTVYSWTSPETRRELIEAELTWVSSALVCNEASFDDRTSTWTLRHRVGTQWAYVELGAFCGASECKYTTYVMRQSPGPAGMVELLASATHAGVTGRHSVFVNLQ
jgi:hypothetical protein